VRKLWQTNTDTYLQKMMMWSDRTGNGIRMGPFSLAGSGQENNRVILKKEKVFTEEAGHSFRFRMHAEYFTSETGRTREQVKPGA
jgi:hypothetical protein